MPRVVRVITYEGSVEWLEDQLPRSLPDGKAPHMPQNITVTTVLDERPSKLIPPESTEEVNRQCQ